MTATCTPLKTVPDTGTSLERELQSATGRELVGVAYRACQLAKRLERRLADIESGKAKP
jgi:pyrimidine operon attenuation protein/uracil phosphoribosyltransferase